MKRGFVIGLLLGLCGGAYATVACGSFDTTLVKLTKVEKDGVAQALPAQIESTIASSGGPSYLYDPESGQYVGVFLAVAP